MTKFKEGHTYGLRSMYNIKLNMPHLCVKITSKTVTFKKLDMNSTNQDNIPFTKKLRTNAISGIQLISMGVSFGYHYISADNIMN